MCSHPRGVVCACRRERTFLFLCLSLSLHHSPHILPRLHNGIIMCAMYMQRHLKHFLHYEVSRAENEWLQKEAERTKEESVSALCTIPPHYSVRHFSSPSGSVGLCKQPTQNKLMHINFISKERPQPCNIHTSLPCVHYIYLCLLQCD